MVKLDTSQPITDVEVEKNISEQPGAQAAPDPKPSENAATAEPKAAEPKAADPGSGFTWSDTNFAEDLMKQKTKASTAGPATEGDASAGASGPAPGTGEKEPTEQEMQDLLSGKHDSEETKMSAKDLHMIAELIIEALDGVNAMGVGAFSGSDPSKYEMPLYKRKHLTVLLAKVLWIYQIKLGPVATLAFVAVLAIGGTWRQGYKDKKQNEANAAEAERKAKQKKNQEMLEGFRVKIETTIGLEKLTLKEISEKMGKTPKQLKHHIEYLCRRGTVMADHSDGLITYERAA